MFRRAKKAVCVIAGGPCPRTSSPEADRFCPFWAENPQEWENVRTGAKIYEHCGARMLWAGTRDAVASGRSSAAASEDLRNVIAKVAGRPRDLPGQGQPARAIQQQGDRS